MRAARSDPRSEQSARENRLQSLVTMSSPIRQPSPRCCLRFRRRGSSGQSHSVPPPGGRVGISLTSVPDSSSGFSATHAFVCSWLSALPCRSALLDLPFRVRVRRPVSRALARTRGGRCRVAHGARLHSARCHHSPRKAPHAPSPRVPRDAPVCQPPASREPCASRTLAPGSERPRLPLPGS